MLQTISQILFGSLHVQMPHKCRYNFLTCNYCLTPVDDSDPSRRITGALHLALKSPGSFSAKTAHDDDDADEALHDTNQKVST